MIFPKIDLTMKRNVLLIVKRNRKFIFIGTLFLVWMIFFDNRNIFVQRNLSKQIQQLEKEKAAYEEKLVQVEADLKAISLHPEKYAREKFFMHRPTEEVFIYHQ